MRKAATNEQRMSLTGAEPVRDALTMPGRPYRSVLKPFVELIRTARREDKSWQEIADLLSREKGVQVTGRAVGKFFASMKKRTSWPLGMEPQPTQAPAATRSPSTVPEDGTGRGSRSRMFPHLEFVRTARRNGDSWRQIVEALQARGVTISHQALSKYFERTQARVARRLDETSSPSTPVQAQPDPFAADEPRNVPPPIFGAPRPTAKPKPTTAPATEPTEAQPDPFGSDDAETFTLPRRNRSGKPQS